MRQVLEAVLQANQLKKDDNSTYPLSIIEKGVADTGLLPPCRKKGDIKWEIFTGLILSLFGTTLIRF